MINKVYLKKIILKTGKGFFVKTTNELIKVLKNSRNIEQFIDDNMEDMKNTTFAEYLNSCLKQHNLSKSEAIENSNIQKNYGYQIFDGSKTPSRNKVLALCLSMGLSVEETNRLLKLSDHSILYPRIKRDSIIHFSLENKYNLIDTNILLHDMNEKIIE